MFVTKRIYEPAADDDGYRVLIDRLWPRGVSKENAHLDAWLRELAPSTDLRRWYGHDPNRWEEFRKRYREELREPEKQLLLDDLARRGRHGKITLLFGSKEEHLNDATVLKEILEDRQAKAA